MKLYFVEPVDKSSYSRRWTVDYFSLQYVRNHYKNYPADVKNIDNGKTIDRWKDFKVTPTKKLSIDFGGAWFVGTPIITEKIAGIEVEVPVTQVSILTAILCQASNKKFKDKDFLKFSAWYFLYALSDNNRNQLYRALSRKAKVYDEIEKGFNKEFDERMKVAKLIQVNKYHKENT